MVPLIVLMIPLLAVGLVIWALATKRYTDGLFMLAVAGSVSAFVMGVGFLEQRWEDAKWQGVVLISVSLVVLMVAAISVKAFDVYLAGSRRAVGGRISGDDSRTEERNEDRYD